MSLSTHVLDIARGMPAAGIEVTLHRLDGDARARIARATTDVDGRIPAPFGGTLEIGTYELTFAIGPYCRKTGSTSFYDEIPIRFIIAEAGGHYHVPLLLSPWGYTTYRGS